MRKTTYKAQARYEGKLINGPVRDNEKEADEDLDEMRQQYYGCINQKVIMIDHEGRQTQTGAINLRNIRCGGRW